MYESPFRGLEEYLGMQILKLCPGHLRQQFDLQFNVLRCGIKESTQARTSGSTGQKQFKVQLMLLNKENVLGYNQ